MAEYFKDGDYVRLRDFEKREEDDEDENGVQVTNFGGRNLFDDTTPLLGNNNPEVNDDNKELKDYNKILRERISNALTY